MTDDTLPERLRNFANGCRGSMWQSRDETIVLMEEAAAALDAAHAERDALRIELEFYADRGQDGYDVRVIEFGPDFGTSTETGAIIEDAGNRARAALKGPRHD